MTMHISDSDLLAVALEDREPSCRCYACKARVQALMQLLTPNEVPAINISAKVMSTVRKERAIAADTFLRETFYNLCLGSILFMSSVLYFGSPHGASVMQFLATEIGASYAQKLFANEQFLLGLLSNPITVLSVILGVLFAARAVTAFRHRSECVHFCVLSAFSFSMKPIIALILSTTHVHGSAQVIAFNFTTFSLVAEAAFVFWLFASGYSLRQIQRGLAACIALATDSSAQSVHS